MSSKLKPFSIAILLSMLAGCEHTPSDRALSGAGLGAGAGAVTAAIVNGNPVTGAAIGAAAGAIGGAVTNDSQVDLGKPWWR